MTQLRFPKASFSGPSNGKVEDLCDASASRRGEKIEER